jgi:hypothetical protein
MKKRKKKKRKRKKKKEKRQKCGDAPCPALWQCTRACEGWLVLAR